MTGFDDVDEIRRTVRCDPLPDTHVRRQLDDPASRSVRRPRSVPRSTTLSERSRPMPPLVDPEGQELRRVHPRDQRLREPPASDSLSTIAIPWS